MEYSILGTNITMKEENTYMESISRIIIKAGGSIISLLLCCNPIEVTQTQHRSFSFRH